MRPSKLLVGVAALAFALGSVDLASAAFVPDPSFGGDGIVTTPIGSNPGDLDVALTMALQPDGRIVAAGGFNEDQFALARYNPDGSLDPTFGAGGKVTADFTPFDGTIGTDEAHTVAIQPDGNIVAGGFVNAFPLSGGNHGDFGVARFQSDGSLDTTFGTGGKAMTTVGDFGGPAFAMALQSDGRIVLAGRASTAGDPDTGEDFALARFTVDGDPDPSFGSGGTVMTDVGGVLAYDQVNALAIQPDGKIVAAGYSTTGQSCGFCGDFALARYNSDGTLDSSFGGDGTVTTPVSTESGFNEDEIKALVIQPDGKIVAAGWAMGSQGGFDRDQFALARYHPDGTLDTTFGTGGTQTTGFGVGEGSVAEGVALQSDGKVVLVGSVTDCSTGECHLDFASARYNPDGSPDPGYGGNGRISTSVAPDPQVDVARAVIAQPDGGILLGGYADIGPPEYLDYDFALVRYADLPDTIAPGVTITRHPRKRTLKHRADFAFKASESGSTFECKLDDRAFKACSSPKTYRRLGSGRHVFKVRATDLSGNTGAPASFAWRIRSG